MKATVLLRKLLGASVVTKSRTGFLIALVATISILGKLALYGFEFLSGIDAAACIALGVLGFITWLIGRVREPKQLTAIPAPDPLGGEVVAEHPLAFLRSLTYWGLILMLSAATLSCLVTWRRHKPALVARARLLEVVTVTVTNVVTITNEAPRPVWPSLELQGVVVNGQKSSAVINGHVLCLGETISNVVLTAVCAESAMVALGGETTVLPLRR
jgi:hypothetical protein